MTGVPGFSGNDGIPVSKSRIVSKSTAQLLCMLTGCLILVCYSLCRATQDKLGPEGNQEQTAVTGPKENLDSQDYLVLMGPLEILCVTLNLPRNL